MRWVRALLEEVRWGSLRRSRTEALSAEALAQWLAEGRALQLLDIRDATAFHQGHLRAARHVPLDRLQQMVPTLDRGLATVIY